MRGRIGHIIFGCLGVGLLIAIGCSSGEQDSQSANGASESALDKNAAADDSPGIANQDDVANAAKTETQNAQSVAKEDPDKLAGFFDPIPDAGATNSQSGTGQSAGGETNSSASSGNSVSAQTVAANTSDASDDPPPIVQQQSAGDSSDNGGHETVDPVETNGPIFENWPKPRLAIVFSGRQEGYFEPCGCAGLENMKGGTARRATMLTQQREAGWPIVAVDLGNVVRRFGRQAEIKSNFTLDALKTMGYDAIGFGPNDLAMPLDHILATVADESRPFVSANVKIPYLDVPKFRVVERGGLKIGITAVLGDEATAEVTQTEIVVTPAAEALAEPYQALLAENCDVLLLLAYATVEETQELAKQYPKFTYTSTAGGPVEPPYLPREYEGISPTLIEVGKKGMYVNVVGLFDDANAPVRYQRVPIDARFPDDERMHQYLVEMQNQYKQLSWAGLDLRPVAHESGQGFVGSETCGECHTRAYRIFKDTGHFHATDTLTKLDPPRQYDPECISCHATGWEPQKYFPFGGGFTSIEATMHLTGNGCENCHGPGSDHVKAEDDPDASDELRQSLREIMRTTLEEAQQNTCLKCHDLDNSPDYIKQGFDAYWPAVEHYGRN